MTGEIIETSSTNCIAQSYQLDEAPKLGSVVKLGENGMGVVYEVRTLSLDPSRKPQALGDGNKNLQKILNEQPQLKSLLRTEFDIRLVGTEGLPDKAPALHATVEEGSFEDLKKNLSYLRYLKDLPAEVLVKHLKLLAGKDEGLKLKAVRELTRLLQKTEWEKVEEVIVRLES